jgi:hypothetical protein
MNKIKNILKKNVIKHHLNYHGIKNFVNDVVSDIKKTQQRPTREEIEDLLHKAFAAGMDCENGHTQYGSAPNFEQWFKIVGLPAFFSLSGTEQPSDDDIEKWAEENSYISGGFKHKIDMIKGAKAMRDNLISKDK